MSTIAATLTAVVREGAERAGVLPPGGPIDVCVPTKDAANGDYQSNAAFRLGKAAGKPPPQVAAAIRDHLPSHPAIADVQIAGPGFLNLKLSDAWLAADVLARAGDEKLGANLVGEGRTLVLDYSSPNIAKRMHVGHLRSTLIGGAIDRMYRFLGWTVVTDNHLGDWGTPYGKLIVQWHDERDDAAYVEDPIGELQRLYQGFADRAEKDPTLLDRARAETVKLQSHDPATIALWQEFVDRSKAELQAVYDRLGCRFDAWLGESAYADQLAPLTEELLAKGVAEESQGAVVIRFTEADGKGLEERPLLIRKADGAALYGTTDLATVRHRIATWNPERIVYVVDTRQQLHFKQVFAGARRMGIPAEVELVHLWFGMLKLPGGMIVATRAKKSAAGDEEAESQPSVNLVDVLNTAAAKAYEVVTEKNPDLPEEERRRIAEVVGVGTIKYFDLSQNPQSDITFSWEKALAVDGGSAVYLQYAYARLHSILRGGGAADAVPAAAPSVAHPTERALAVLVARTPEVAAAAAEAYRPNLIAEHLEHVAKAVGPFYDSCPVLKEGVPPDIRAARLSLVYAVAHTLRVGLDLLGIGVVPRM